MKKIQSSCSNSINYINNNNQSYTTFSCNKASQGLLNPEIESNLMRLATTFHREGTSSFNRESDHLKREEFDSLLIWLQSASKEEKVYAASLFAVKPEQFMLIFWLSYYSMTESFAALEPLLNAFVECSNLDLQLIHRLNKHLGVYTWWDKVKIPLRNPALSPAMKWTRALAQEEIGSLFYNVAVNAIKKELRTNPSEAKEVFAILVPYYDFIHHEFSHEPYYQNIFLWHMEELLYNEENLKKYFKNINKADVWEQRHRLAPELQTVLFQLYFDYLEENQKTERMKEVFSQAVSEHPEVQNNDYTPIPKMEVVPSSRVLESLVRASKTEQEYNECIKYVLELKEDQVQTSEYDIFEVLLPHLNTFEDAVSALQMIPVIKKWQGTIVMEITQLHLILDKILAHRSAKTDDSKDYLLLKVLRNIKGFDKKICENYLINRLRGNPDTLPLALDIFKISETSSDEAALLQMMPFVTQANNVETFRIYNGIALTFIKSCRSILTIQTLFQTFFEASPGYMKLSLALLNKWGEQLAKSKDTTKINHYIEALKKCLDRASEEEPLNGKPFSFTIHAILSLPTLRKLVSKNNELFETVFTQFLNSYSHSGKKGYFEFNAEAVRRKDAEKQQK